MLRLGVEGGGSLVEQQHRRLTHKRTRNGDALLLTARELRAALTDKGVVPVFEGGDELVSIGERGGAHDSVRIGARVLIEGLEAIADVVAKRASEERRLLPDEGDVPVEPAWRELRDRRGPRTGAYASG